MLKFRKERPQYNWMRGEPLKRLVKNKIGTKKAEKDIPDDDVDKAIDIVMDIINKHVSYRLPKYFNVYSEILSFVHNEALAEVETCSLGISAMLEFGAFSSCAISLMSACIPRATAFELEKYIPDECKDSPLSWLVVNQDNVCFNKLPRLHRRILQKLNIW